MGRQQFDTAIVKKRCEDKLDIAFRDGKEYNGWFVHDGVRICRVTVAKGKKDLPPKTYRSIATQLHLDEAQLDDLIDCPLKRDGYIRELRRSGAIKPRPAAPPSVSANTPDKKRRRRR